MRDEQGRTLEAFLAEYDETRYRRPSATVDMAVFVPSGRDLRVLLIKRRNHPYIGRWALPGGFVEMDEELEQAAARELQEETGVVGAALRQFGTFGGVGRDPRTRVISTGFFALVPEEELAFAAGDDAADAALFSIEKLVRTARSARGDTYRIALAGPDVLTCHARLVYDDFGAKPALCGRPGEGGLGGDHDFILFSALYALYSSVRPRPRETPQGARGFLRCPPQDRSPRARSARWGKAHPPRG